MRQRRAVHIIASLLICIFVVAPLCPGASLAEQRRVVKVGFFAFDGYHMINNKGEFGGYGYDIVQYMSGYTSLAFEFVGYEASWGEAQDMLLRGDIDLLTSSQKTDERLQRFGFSDRAIGTSSAILTVKAGDTKYILDDYANWSGMRVGMIKDNSRNDQFAEFAVQKGFTYTSKYYEDVDEMLAALKNNEDIDAVVTSNLRKTEGEWVLAQFDASPFYIVTRKDDTELLNEINAALDKLYAAMPKLDSLLMSKYYLTDNGHNIAFTVEERQIIEASKDVPIKAGVISASAPVCYLDAETGEYKGISMDILRAVGSKTGLQMEFLPINLQLDTPVGWLKKGEFDLVVGILKEQTFVNDLSLALSSAIITDALVMLGRSGDDITYGDDKVIAVPAGFQIGLAYVRSQFPNHAVISYPTFEECMGAVAGGDADATVYMRTSASYALQNPHYETLAIIPSYSREVSTCAACNASGGSLLMDIIDKGLAMIAESERNAIMLNYTILNPYRFSFGDALYKYRVPVHVIIALLLLIIAAVAVVINMRHKTNSKLRDAYQRTSEALRQAERANASKSQFLSRVSHEMRTPLNAIIGFMELSSGADEQTVQTYLKNADIAAKQLLSVINDVLDMSSIEAGKLTLANASFDFKQLVHAVTNVYLPQCRDKGLEYETRILTPVDERLVGDQMRVKQILFNLLSNAVKFTKQGHVHLLISQTESRQDNVFIRFQVVDTGCGMSDEMKGRLFVPFEQESSLTAARYGGSGLGLSIVKNLVSLMNGAIRADSVQGEGTIFTVDIPFARSDASAQIELPDGKRDLRVLAVDDEETERDYLRVVLNRMGIRNDCVPDGASAIRELTVGETQGDPYKICLIDWKMPDMDGIETTRSIRRRFGEDVLVIVVSAYDQNQASTKATEAGANMFLPKPLFQSALFDLFMTLTGGKIAEKSVANAPAGNFVGKRVMLAEDNAMNRIVAGALISKLGIECECVDDGEAAVKRFCEAPAGYFDAVLMDIQMPVMDGFEATRLIRESGHLDARRVQIIALTANAFTEDIAKSLSAGMNAHISKPIKPELLIKELEKAFMANEAQADKRRKDT